MGPPSRASPSWDLDWKLVCTEGADRHREFPLKGDEVVVGRAPACGVCLSDEGVARQHLSLRRRPTGWTARDVSPGLGAALNGQPLCGERPLHAGDLLSLGRCRLVLLEGEQTVLQAPADSVRRPPEDAERTVTELPAEETRAAPAAPPLALPRKSPPAELASSVPPTSSFVATRADLMMPSDEPTATLPVAHLAGRGKAHKPVRRRPEEDKAARRRRRAIGLGLAAVVAALAPLAVIGLWPRGQEDGASAVALQEAKNLLRARRWAEAQARLSALKGRDGSPEGVDELIARAEREQANEEALSQAREAIGSRRLGKAAEALKRVSPDTQLVEEVRSLDARLKETASAMLTEARQAVQQGDLERAIGLTTEILSANPVNADAAGLRERAMAARAESQKK